MSENSEPKLTQLKLLILSETVGNPKVFYEKQQILIFSMFPVTDLTSQ